MNPALLCLIATAAGAAVGLLFGRVQALAAARLARRQLDGQLHSGWSIMPGSFGRIAYLLLALVAVQVAVPAAFSGPCQWFVSGGVVAGYGWTLYRGLLQRRGVSR